MKGVRRVLPGSGQPFERFWKVVDAATSESGEGELWFYGPISEFSWAGDEITPKLMRDDLAKFGDKPITLRIHSAGGEVFAASAIRSMLMAYPGHVTAKIEGLCASAATYVAMAADTVQMQDSAFFMVHDPWTIAMGGVKEFTQVVKMLKALKKGIIETYQNKTSQSSEVLEKMMEDETWMSAQKALELGFVDEVITERSASQQFEELARAANAAIFNFMPDFDRLPAEVKSMYRGMPVNWDAFGDVHGPLTMNEQGSEVIKEAYRNGVKVGGLEETPQKDPPPQSPSLGGGEANVESSRERARSIELLRKKVIEIRKTGKQ